MTAHDDDDDGHDHGDDHTPKEGGQVYFPTFLSAPVVPIPELGPAYNFDLYTGFAQELKEMAE